MNFCYCHPHKGHRRLWIGVIFTVFSGEQRSSLFDTPSFFPVGGTEFSFFLFLSQCKHHNTAKLSALHRGCYWLHSLFGAHTSLLILRKVTCALNKAGFFIVFFFQTHNCWQHGESEVGQCIVFPKCGAITFFATCVIKSTSQISGR